MSSGTDSVAGSDVVDLEGTKAARVEVLTEVFEGSCATGRREAVQELSDEDVGIVCEGGELDVTVFSRMRLLTLVDGLGDRMGTREGVDVSADGLCYCLSAMATVLCLRGSQTLDELRGQPDLSPSRACPGDDAGTVLLKVSLGVCEASDLPAQQVGGVRGYHDELRRERWCLASSDTVYERDQHCFRRCVVPATSLLSGLGMAEPKQKPAAVAMRTRAECASRMLAG